MNFKTTYILFGLLIGVLGLFLLTQLFGKRTRPKEETLRFYRDEHGDWRLKEPSTRADSTQINRVINQVMGARKEEQADTTPT